MITPHLLNSTDITVGWERTSFNVSEDVGTFQAFYNVMFPTNTTSITNPFYMRVTTVVGTAGEKFSCACMMINCIMTILQLLYKVIKKYRHRVCWLNR